MALRAKGTSLAINMDQNKRQMKLNKVLVLIWMACMPFMAQANLKAFFNGSNTFFERYVRSGKVDYALVKKNFSHVDVLYKQIGEEDLSQASLEEKKAFYINAYNIIVIYQVSKYYPLKSALDQSGFFDKVKHKVSGEMLSLNALEIKKLLIPFKDPRIHFVLACAAISCPPLASFSYHPENLEQNLEKRTIGAINDPNFIRVSSQNKEAQISQIFKWYKKDFDNNSGSVLTFINKYKKTAISSDYKISYYEYNWSLNKQ